MTVEIVEFIDSLDRTNPKGSDPISEGDDHVRNIKAAIVDTFPNVKGEVTASHEEINQLTGLSELVDGALPDRPTEDSSLLHNSGNKWTETTTIKISGNKAFIPALAGLGNVNLYVNNDGEILASKQADDPTWQHGVNDHTDVDFDGNPEEDDVMMYDGSAWKSKQFEGGNTMNVTPQPTTCGNFSASPTYTQQWVKRVGVNSGTLNFNVPSGLKFFLKNITCERDTPTSGQYVTLQVPFDSVVIDGVTLFSGFNGEVQDNRELFDDTNDPMYQSKSKISIDYYCNTSEPGAGGEIVVSGYFVEDR